MGYILSKMGIRKSKMSVNIANASKVNGTDNTVTVKEIKDVPQENNTQSTEEPPKTELTDTQTPPANGGTVEAEKVPAVDEPVTESEPKTAEESAPAPEKEK